MIRFVVALTPSGQLSPEAAVYLASPDLAEFPSPPERHVRWTDPASTTHFAGWEAGPQRHSLVDAGLVSFAGLPRPQRTRWRADRPVAELLRDSIRSPRWSPAERLCDAYALVGLDETGSGVITMDPLGLHPLYLATTGDVTVVGNRADLVAEVAARQSGRPARRDPLVGGWLALIAHPVDDGTGFDGVRLFPQHTTARIHAGRVSFETDVPPFVCDPYEPQCDPAEVAEELAADIVAALQYAIARSPDRPHLELTGGKDSRLVLAVALHAGLADSFTWVTYGPEDLPDVQVARSVAASCGLAHEDVSVSHLAPALSVPLAERYLRHVHRTSGTSHLGNANEPVPGEVLTVSGMLGEIYRTANDRDAAAPPRSWAEAAQRFQAERHLNRLGLVRQEIAPALIEQSISRYLEPRDAVRGPEALRLAFFLRCRLPRWQGPLADLHERRVLPLYSPAAIRATFRMGHEARAQDRVHRYLVERTSRALAEHPLANERWRGNGAPQAEPVDGAPSFRRFAHPAQHERRRVLLELLEANGASPLFELVDSARLRAAVEGLDESGQDYQARVLGAMAAVIWLGRMERRRRVGHD
ncbi:MAG: hypothetical protein ACJ73V_02325 [Acidimicrobiia bacterium]